MRNIEVKQGFGFTINKRLQLDVRCAPSKLSGCDLPVTLVRTRDYRLLKSAAKLLEELVKAKVAERCIPAPEQLNMLSNWSAKAQRWYKKASHR